MEEMAKRAKKPRALPYTPSGEQFPVRLQNSTRSIEALAARALDFMTSTAMPLTTPLFHKVPVKPEPAKAAAEMFARQSA